MKILVTDANIFIDLHYVNCPHWLTYLDGEIHTTDIVLHELYQEQVAIFKPYIHVIAEADIIAINNLQPPEINSRLSDADRSVIWYAKENEAKDTILLTGDNSIRKWCLKNDMNVHGILWVFDKAVAGKHVHPAEVCERLQKLRQLNLWLPVKECEEQIKKWSDSALL